MGELIREKLQVGLNSDHVEVKDQSDGCGGKFEAIIVSTKFEGVGLLARHRMVNAVLEEELKTIHAFSQKTFTPGQWKQKQSALAPWIPVVIRKQSLQKKLSISS